MGIVIAIAIFPADRKLRSVLSGRGKLAAVVCTLFLLAVLILPVALLTETVIEGIQSLTARIRNGTLSVPPPQTEHRWSVDLCKCQVFQVQQDET
jgi:predicted PurR-regulated permease PerM